MLPRKVLPQKKVLPAAPATWGGQSEWKEWKEWPNKLKALPKAHRWWKPWKPWEWREEPKREPQELLDFAAGLEWPSGPCQDDLKPAILTILYIVI